MVLRCVIFGGSGDIGGAIAHQLMTVGCEVVTVSRRSSAPREHATHHVPADVTDENSVRQAVRQILKDAPIDAVVYAVGLSPDVGTPLSEYESSDWRRTFAAYVDGLFYVYNAVFPALSSSGHFVVIASSITGFKSDELPPFHAGHYAAAKAAVDEFSKWARREAHGKGALFSRLAPGSVRSAASAVLGIPEACSLPLEAVSRRVVSALVHHEELDEEMIVQAQ